MFPQFLRFEKPHLVLLDQLESAGKLELTTGATTVALVHGLAAVASRYLGISAWQVVFLVDDKDAGIVVHDDDVVVLGVENDVGYGEGSRRPIQGQRILQLARKLGQTSSVHVVLYDL